VHIGRIARNTIRNGAFDVIAPKATTA
jgi:hypothetical protein